MSNKAIASVKSCGKNPPRSWMPKTKYGPSGSKKRLPGIVLNKH